MNKNWLNFSLNVIPFIVGLITSLIYTPYVGIFIFAILLLIVSIGPYFRALGFFLTSACLLFIYFGNNMGCGWSDSGYFCDKFPYYLLISSALAISNTMCILYKIQNTIKRSVFEYISIVLIVVPTVLFLIS